MTKEEAIKISKQMRKEAEEMLDKLQEERAIKGKGHCFAALEFFPQTDGHDGLPDVNYVVFTEQREFVKKTMKCSKGGYTSSIRVDIKSRKNPKVRKEILIIDNSTEVYWRHDGRLKDLPSGIPAYTVYENGRVVYRSRRP